MGQWRPIRGLGVIRWRQERERVAELLRALGLDLNGRTDVRLLNTTDRVMCCIARAMIRARVIGDQKLDVPRALLLDEPTSALPDEEITRFSELLLSIKERFNVGIVLVTHNPNDVERLADSITALREGRVTLTAPVKDLGRGELLTLMSGAPIEADGTSHARSRHSDVDRTPIMRDEDTLLVEHMTTDMLTEPLELHVRSGEIVGLTGVVGSGYDTAIHGIVGAATKRSGKVRIRGQLVPNGLVDFVRSGGIFIARGRVDGAGVGEALVRENLTLGATHHIHNSAFVTAGRERRLTLPIIEQLGLKAEDLERQLSELSGGQQQKIIIGRALLSGADLIALEEPTEAIDVGARAEIAKLLRTAAGAGAGVLVASAEYETLSEICDRVIVFRLGRIAAELSGGQIKPDNLLSEL